MRQKWPREVLTHRGLNTEDFSRDMENPKADSRSKVKYIPPRRNFPPIYLILTYASHLAIPDIAPWQPDFMYPLCYPLVYAAGGILKAIS